MQFNIFTIKMIFLRNIQGIKVDDVVCVLLQYVVKAAGETPDTQL